MESTSTRFLRTLPKRSRWRRSPEAHGEGFLRVLDHRRFLRRRRPPDVVRVRVQLRLARRHQDHLAAIVATVARRASRARRASNEATSRYSRRTDHPASADRARSRSFRLRPCGTGHHVRQRSCPRGGGRTTKDHDPLRRARRAQQRKHSSIWVVRSSADTVEEQIIYLGAPTCVNRPEIRDCLSEATHGYEAARYDNRGR